MEYIQVGKIVNTHGIRGDVKVLPLTDDVKRFEDLKHVFIGDEKLKLDITKVAYVKGNVLLKFRQYDNINDVEKFKNSMVFIDEKDKIKLPEDSFFLNDIIGIEVYLEDDTHLGTIKDILQPGANDVYVVKNGSNEYLIPAIKNVVKKVDIDEKKMVIAPLEGMLE